MRRGVRDRGSRYIHVALAARGGAHRTPPSKFVLGREREREKGVVRNYMYATDLRRGGARLTKERAL